MKNLKKVNVFKTTFPDGSTHYGVSEQAHTVDSYLKKCISIAIGNINSGRGWSTFHSTISKYKLDSVVNLIKTFDNSLDAREFRNSLIKNDINSINQLSAGTLSKLDGKVTSLKLPILNSKLLTNKDGERVYYVDILFAKKSNIFDKVNVAIKHPMFSNMIQVKPNLYKVERI